MSNWFWSSELERRMESGKADFDHGVIFKVKLVTHNFEVTFLAHNFEG